MPFKHVPGELTAAARVPCRGHSSDAYIGSIVLDALVTDERDRRLWHAVSSLPSGERTVVYLYYRQDMKVSDIAHALDVADGTVKTQLFRARKRLRAALASEALR